jgi:response regulator NasT
MSENTVQDGAIGMNAKIAAPASILLVDDDRLILATLGEGLSRAGYRMTGVSSAEEGLERAREQRFDLALVDMRLPGMSGAELAGQLREEFGCYSLVLSAYSDLEIAKDAARHGTLGYLIKPIDVLNLLPAIESAIARARDLAALRTTQEQLNTALQQGRETSIAIGILMERMAVGRNAAFARLRDAARSQRRRVSEVASEMLRAAETLNSEDAAPGAESPADS